MNSKDSVFPLINNELETLRPSGNFSESISIPASGMSSRLLKDNGELKEILIETSDIKGVLSLFEAAHVGTHEDNILEDALPFIITHLKDSIKGGSGSISDSFANQVNHALEQSLHKGIPRIESRYYMSIYEADETHNPLLLKLAKLDFILAQMSHKQELNEIFRKCSENVAKLAHTRNRLVENYFMAMSILFEPQYSLGRIIFAKTVVALILVDDTFVAYGTSEELRAFTDAVERELPSFPQAAFIYSHQHPYYSWKMAPPEVFDWLSKNPKILVACARIGRLINDVASYEDYNAGEEEAKNKLEEICEDAWKDINEGLLRPTDVPREIVMRILSLARVVGVYYKHRNDGFTNPATVVETHIAALLLDPFSEPEI
ncbi:OLC1v1012174C1 [Oldenlandia corymbosa var. corymbosa]|uniref:OLC1v1012174C1 n=1 Tax=Oldenlandia corymbosa var. corymbosa TaxID=529605 RepID=A0AAV1DYE8_OLDCO|nr:OLC1v1012174C1 [Oldenlandia corymbosa var. corymbosa]